MNHKIFLLAAIFATALLTSGCSKESPSTTSETMPEAPSPQTLLTTTQVVKAVSDVTNAAAQALAAVTNSPSVAAATNQAATNTTAAAGGVQSVLERVKSLIAQKQYGEAASALASLKNQNLSTEQQSLWQKLQAEVQKALAANTANDGAKALGGLLGK